MSGAFDDAQEAHFSAARDRHVARHLDIAVEDLADHPYEIDEVTLTDGTVIGWRVLWSDQPPQGVEVRGGPDHWWNEIPVGEFDSSNIQAAAALSILASAMTRENRVALEKTGHNMPVSGMDMVHVGNEMMRFMSNITGTLMHMDGHNRESLKRLSQAVTVIDDFAAAVLHAARWKSKFEWVPEDE